MQQESKWERKLLGELVDINVENLSQKTPGNTPIEYIDIASIEKTGYIAQTKQYTFSNAPSRARRVVRTGDVIVSTVRPYLKAFALVTDEHNGKICSTGFAVLRPKKGVDSRFIYQTVIDDRFIEYLKSKMTGSSYPAVRPIDIAVYPLDVPKYEEQRKIAAILSSVDEAIEKTEAIIEQTEKVKKGLMQQLLTKGIGHTKFKKTEIGEIPEEWEVKQLAEVCVVNPTYRIEKGTICSYVEMGAVNENSPHISYFGKREAGQGGGSRFKENDVLFARITPCTENGKTALVPKLESEVGLGSTEFIVLSPLKQILDPKFLYYFVKSDRVRNYAISRMTGTTGRQRVPKEVFEQELMIALPPIDEQKKIGEILYNYDKKIDHEKRWKNQLQTIKKALMQVLLTGKVRVKVDDEVMSQ
ncbi:restriction endonuclease subunit S [Anoxybacillus tepidamans]|uniref:restriction endonuclease subunit S n=1 Tax=Anoxybacteroides tepidamans TaxID=265948 RepID=UPI0005558161|nr:restriction endonuclease subunit S [Anoxybacillus tepidamans]